MLQSTKAKFNQYNVEQICPLCRLASEDLQHMLMKCPALAEVRGPHISSIRKLLSQNFGMSWWLSRSSEQIVALCLDGSNITVQSNYIPEEGFVGRQRPGSTMQALLSQVTYENTTATQKVVTVIVFAN